MTAFAIRLVDVPDAGDTGEPPYALRMVRPFAGHYLTSYDPDAREGLGQAVWDESSADALRFPSFDAAKACWWQQSTKAPTRMYRGQEIENRPLAPISISIDPL